MSTSEPASAEEVSVPAARDPLTDALASARSAAPGPSAAHAPPAADGAAGAADATHDAAAEPPAADAAGDDVSAQPPRPSGVPPATRTASGTLFTEDDAGPDWTEPEAWTQAADFIVQVHTQMPGELLHEAQRGLAISALLVDKVVEKLGPCLGTRRRAEPAPPVQQQQQPSTRADK